MDCAKALSKGCVEVFNPSMPLANLALIELEEALRQAIDARSIEVVYQPVVELATGRLEGFEALARWSHPRLGVVAPDVFVPIAERLGLISELGSQVLEQAHASAVLMHARSGRPVTIGVNVSAAQVTEFRLCEQVRRLTAAEPGVHLVLELTEGTLVADDTETSEALLAWTGAGASLAVDDFGVGYASIGYLHRLPVRTVKIDKSFVQQLHDDRARILVQGVIAMVDAMDMQVVAEGIEDWVTAAMVRDLGCRYGQGFLLAVPLSLAEAIEAAVRGCLDLTPMTNIHPLSPPASVVVAGRTARPGTPAAGFARRTAPGFAP